MGSLGADEVVLYNHPVSHYGQRVHITLLEKGIPFKTVVPDLRNKPKELTDANPVYGKIPSLVHNGNAVNESLIILEYLDEAWPETWRLLPKDPVERATARFWADFMYKGWDSMSAAMRAPADSPERSAAVEAVRKFAKTLDAHMAKVSGDGPFFNGPEFGYLDVILAPLLCWSAVMEKVVGAPLPEATETPRLSKWMKDVTSRKSVKEALPPPDDVASFYAEIRKKVAAAQAAAAAPAS